MKVSGVAGCPATEGRTLPRVLYQKGSYTMTEQSSFDPLNSLLARRHVVRNTFCVNSNDLHPGKLITMHEYAAPRRSEKIPVLLSPKT